MKTARNVLLALGASALGAMILLSLAKDVTAEPAPLKPPPLTTSAKPTTKSTTCNPGTPCYSPGPQHAPGSPFDNS